MPHIQDVIAGHYVSEAEEIAADALQAEIGELGSLHYSNMPPRPENDPLAVQWVYSKLIGRGETHHDNWLREWI